MIMKSTLLQTFQKVLLSVSMSAKTLCNLATIMKNLSGLSRQDSLKMENSASSTLMVMLMLKVAYTVICNLYETRTDLGYTLRKIAEGTDMNVRTLINIKKEGTIPTLLYSMKLENFLNKPVEQLFEYRSANQISYSEKHND